MNCENSSHFVVIAASERPFLLRNDLCKKSQSLLSKTGAFRSRKHSTPSLEAAVPDELHTSRMSAPLSLWQNGPGKIIPSGKKYEVSVVSWCDA